MLFRSQAFIPHSLEKVRRVRRVLDANGSSAPIEVDGGVDAGNIGALVAAGASILVAGQAIFGAPDPTAALKGLRAAATGVVPVRAE